MTGGEPFARKDLVDIAKNIIVINKNLKFVNFEDISKELTILSVAESLKLIKISALSTLENGPFFKS